MEELTTLGELEKLKTALLEKIHSRLQMPNQVNDFVVSLNEIDSLIYAYTHLLLVIKENTLTDRELRDKNN
jgi:hypothetical protein